MDQHSEQPQTITLAALDVLDVDRLCQRLGSAADTAGVALQVHDGSISQLTNGSEPIIVGFSWPEFAVARAVCAGQQPVAALAAWKREARAALKLAKQGRARLFSDLSSPSAVLSVSIPNDGVRSPSGDRAIRVEAALVLVPGVQTWMECDDEAHDIADALAEIAGTERFQTCRITADDLSASLDAWANGVFSRTNAQIEALRSAVEVCREDLELFAGTGAQAGLRERVRAALAGSSVLNGAISGWRALKRRAFRNADLELLRNSNLFDGDWYCRRFPDVDPHHIEPVLHYLLHGGAEGRPPSPDFDASAYMALNVDVEPSGMNPLVHYLRRGKHEGRPAVTLRGDPIAQGEHA